tara:strand:- start:21011 stop:21364 length:354 start_codon:yes stop_codon:yes gene_type:complete
MTSTRNNNTSIDYNLQQKYNTNMTINNFYSGYCVPNSEIIPTIGTISSRRNRYSLASNSVDIESNLFGINSTNLIKPSPTVEPLLNKIPQKSFFDRQDNVIMPYPLVFNNNDRPSLN